MWRERRGVPAVPSLELIGYVTRWPNPPGLMCCAADLVPWGQGGGVRPFGPACLRPWEQGRGPRRGSPPLSSCLSPSPRPRGDVYSWATSAGWQATRLLFECLESPRSQENGAHSLGPAFAFSLCSRGEFWQLTCHPIHPSRHPALYLCQTLTWSFWVLRSLLCPLPSACHFPHTTLPRVTLWVHEPQTFKNRLRLCASSSPQGQTLSLVCLGVPLSLHLTLLP